MSTDKLDLADWRRRVAELYAAVRASAYPEAAWHLWRAERDTLFKKHPQSPLPPEERADFDGLPYFDYDAAFRFEAELEPLPGGTVSTTDLGADGIISMASCGRTTNLTGPLGGELTVYWIAGYGGGLFLPFSDSTAGANTFGGGRYLLDSIKAADLGMVGGKLILDFNFAYNPSCSYSAAWSCPLAPPENHLPTPIRAGELAVRLPVGAAPVFAEC